MVFPWVIMTFALSYLLSLVVEYIAKKRGYIAKASYRRKKIESVPLLGGIAIFVAAAIGVPIVDHQVGPILLLSALPLFFIGIIDDLAEIKGRTKLTAQFISAALFIALIGKDNLLMMDLLPHTWLAIFVTTAFIVGATNSFNLIDGMDGFATTTGLILWGALAVSHPGEPLPWIMMAAQSGFLVRNFHPAQVYLGEVGSGVMGFLLGAYAMTSPTTLSSWNYFIGVLFLFSVPLTDTVTAIWRRLVAGKSLFHGDRDHIHHRLLKLHFKVPQALMILALMVFGGAMTFILTTRIPSSAHQWGLFVLSASLLTTLYFGIVYCERHFSMRVIGFGKSLLERHFAQVGLSRKIESPTRAFVLDLLPYFRELQSHGVMTVNRFIEDLAKVVSRNAKSARVEFLGSYSIAVLFEDVESWSAADKTRICEALNHLFSEYHCLRGNSKIPEGLTFCHKEQLRPLLKLFEIRVEPVAEKLAS